MPPYRKTSYYDRCGSPFWGEDGATGADSFSVDEPTFLPTSRVRQNVLVQQDLMRAAKTQEENYLLYVRKPHPV
jgi:hypothetical protein